MEEKNDYGDRTVSTVSKLRTDPRKLNLARVKVYGAPILALSDLWAIPDVMSPALCQKLHLAPSSTNRRITMVYNKKPTVIGKLVHFPFTVGAMTVELSYLVAQSTLMT